MRQGGRTEPSNRLGSGEVRLEARQAPAIKVFIANVTKNSLTAKPVPVVCATAGKQRENKMAVAEQELSDRGITRGASVRWPGFAQDRYGTYVGIEQAFPTSKPRAIVLAMNGRLLLEPGRLVAAPEIHDPFKADYEATYGNRHA